MDSKSINQNHYLIGSTPEIIKTDIMNFKEEVLQDIKELGQKLEEKYFKINKELNNNIELYNKKITEFDFKLLDLSSKIVNDITIKEKISDLLNFKEKTDNNININKIKISMLDKEINQKMDRIDDLIANSLIFPGLIGPGCKYKKMSEFIEYLYSQVNSLNDFKEKNLIDLGLYKTKIENLLTEVKIKMGSVKKEANFFSLDNIQKSEKTIFNEISLRDERLKNMKVRNEENFLKLEKNIKNIFDDINIIKDINNNMNDKIITLENKIYENFIKVDEKQNEIENKINNLNNNLQDTLKYLNKNGANIKIIKSENDNKSQEINDNKQIINKNIQDSFNNERNRINLNINKTENNKSLIDSEEAKKENIDKKENSKKNEIKKIINHITVKNKNIKPKDEIENTKENNIKDNIKKRLKSSYVSGSDIGKYVRGEITADEIGLSLNRHHKFMNIYRNQYSEKLIGKSEYEKSFTNQHFMENLTHNDLIIKKNNYNDEINNFDLYLNYTNSSESGKILKPEKRKAKSFITYKNILKIDFNDISAKFHSDELSNNIGNKSSRNNENNKNYLTKINQESNHILNKNTSFNLTRILNPNKAQNIKEKFIVQNLNSIPSYKVISFKNLNKELSRNIISDFERNYSDKNRLLSPYAKKINKFKVNLENNINFNKLKNNVQLPPKLLLTKIKRKIINFDFDNSNNKDEMINSNNKFDSTPVENKK